jgi:hypothetical protein
LAQNLQKSSRAWGEGAQRYLREKQEQIMRFLLALDRHVEASGYTLPSLLVLLTGLLIYRRRRSVIDYVFARWAVRVRRSGNLTASLAALEYREMLRLLEKRGWRKVPSETPAEFASTISRPDLATLVVRLTELYQNVRFGGHPTGAKEMASLLGSIRELLRNQRRIPETS